MRSSGGQDATGRETMLSTTSSVPAASLSSTRPKSSKSTIAIASERPIPGDGPPAASTIGVFRRRPARVSRRRSGWFFSRARLPRPMKGTSMDRRQFCAGIVAGALPLAGARAQTWPDKPVNIILSQPPGSGPDNIARLLADRLGHMWGKVVVILNKPGGQNIIGAQAAARSAPDGYTFYFATTAALVSNVYLFKQLPYDPVKDFDPVAFVATSPFGLMVPGASPIRSIDEFIAASKAAPDKLTLANEGPRTLGGMAARLFNARAGIRNNLVPYASASVGIQDALAGRVDAIVVDLAATTQYIKHGDLRLLATTSAQRLKGWDATPALGE